MATQKRFQARAGLDNNSQTIIGVADPVNAQDAATKAFSSNASNLATGTLPAARLPAFTGDASVAVGTSTITLSNSGATAGTYKSVTVDAKGRVTAGTNPTTLAGYGITDAQPLDAELTAIAGLTTNGLIVKTAAGAATTRSVVVSGTGLSISNADGVAGNPTITSNATNANTVSTIVARDASGNFSAGTITATLSGNASTATTATSAGTASNISNTGTVTLASATESNAITITAPAYSTDKPVKLLNFDWYGNTFSLGNIRSGATPSSGFGVYYTASGGAITEIARFDVGGTFNVVGAITQAGNQVLHAGNYNSYAPTLTGAGASGTWGISITGSSASTTGNAGTATALATGRTIGMTGDVSWTSASFNGSANVTGTATLANSGVTAGTYKSVTVDAKGRVTAGTNPTTLSGYGITDAQPLDADLTAIAGLAGTSGFLKKTAANTWSLDTATYLTGNQAVTISGDASGTGTTAISLTLANSGVTAGTYNNAATSITPFTIDAKGRVTGTGAAVTITPAWSSITGKPTTLAGYGITDAASASHTHTNFSNMVTFGAATRTAHAELINQTTQNIDLSTADFFTYAVTGPITFTVSNVPTSGVVASFILELINGGSDSITWWSSIKWPGGTAPTLSIGRDVLGFYTHDNGVTWTGLILGKDVK